MSACSAAAASRALRPAAQPRTAGMHRRGCSSRSSPPAPDGRTVTARSSEPRAGFYVQAGRGPGRRNRGGVQMLASAAPPGGCAVTAASHRCQPVSGHAAGAASSGFFRLVHIRCSWRAPIQVITGLSNLTAPFGRTCPDHRIRVSAAAGSNLSV